MRVLRMTGAAAGMGALLVLSPMAPGVGNQQHQGLRRPGNPEELL